MNRHESEMKRRSRKKFITSHLINWESSICIFPFSNVCNRKHCVILNIDFIHISLSLVHSCRRRHTGNNSPALSHDNENVASETKEIKQTQVVKFFLLACGKTKNTLRFFYSSNSSLNIAVLTHFTQLLMCYWNAQCCDNCLSHCKFPFAGGFIWSKFIPKI